jgi:uncharacterized protein YbcI
MPDIETRNEIMKTLYNAILQADEDYANTAHLLLTRYQEEYIEEEAQILEEATIIDELPPEIKEIIKDPDINDLVKQYKKTDEQYTVEKSLVDLDDVIEKPELELEDKQEKLDDLKDISAKLIANGASNSLGVIQEIGEKVAELKTDIQEREDTRVGKQKTTKRTRRRRSY